MSNEKIPSKQILQILVSPYIGGVEVYTLELDKKMLEKNVNIYFLSNLHPILEKLKLLGAKVLHIHGKKVGGVKRAFLVIILQPLYFLYYFPLLIYFRFIKKVKNVHVQDIGEKFVLSALCKLLGFKVIWTEHGILTSWLKNRFILNYFRFVSSFADVIVAVSDLTQKDLIGNLKISPTKIKIIYNSVDLSLSSFAKYSDRKVGDESEEYFASEDFAPMKREEKIPRSLDRGASLPEVKSKKSKSIIASYIGRITSDKKIGEFISKIPPNSDIEFHFVGDGDLLVDLKKNYSQALNIKFFGFQSDKQKFLAETDIFIHPSLHPGEGMSLGILEAMSSGKPVIAFDTGGMKELVKSNINGYLITNGNYKEFFNRINKLSKNYKLRLEMGEMSRNMVQEKFNLDKNVEEFTKLLQ